jgi:amino acid adenylation domain-containing protein
MILTDLVKHTATGMPEAIVVKSSDGQFTYRELDFLANQIAHALYCRGVRTGDRVGIWCHKSLRTVAAMQAVLRLGAVYVPLDPLSPIARIYAIMQDCRLRAIITTHHFDEHLSEHIRLEDLLIFYLDESQKPGSRGIDWREIQTYTSAVLPVQERQPDEMAYILYTSGSTGTPKGVCISHRNALAFIEWAAQAIAASPQDRFASHAPFHFDLSVLDLYVAFLVGATVVLIPDSIAYMPQPLVQFLQEEQITIWYSVPSALMLMMDAGYLFEAVTTPPRVILFAGEPFPLKHLKRLYKRWPQVRYMNLYGPTETNVCTFYEIKDLPDDQEEAIPIGKACSGDSVWAQKTDGTKAGPGETGELMVTGPTVMMGYWGKEPVRGNTYATGDLVCVREDGNFVYLGRRDHMVKVRGHRIELRDVEIALEKHPAIREVAVSVDGEGMQARLVACIVFNEGMSLSLLAIKKHCADRLPRYMIVDVVKEFSQLPRTRNGKIDRLALTNARKQDNFSTLKGAE